MNDYIFLKLSEMALRAMTESHIRPWRVKLISYHPKTGKADILLADMMPTYVKLAPYADKMLFAVKFPKGVGILENGEYHICNTGLSCGVNNIEYL